MNTDWLSILGLDSSSVSFSVAPKGMPLSEAIRRIVDLKEHKCSFNPLITRMLRDIAALRGDKETRDVGMAFVEEQWPEEKQDLLLTWASGSSDKFYKYMRVFVASAKEYMPDCDKVVLTHDMPLDRREWLQEEGFRVWDVYPQNIECLIRDRCFEFHDFLTRFAGRYKRVLISDCRDVVFQGSIFDHYKYDWSKPGKDCKGYLDFCLVFSEGALHRELDWNIKDQQLFREAIGAPHDFYGSWEVINGGLLFGTPTDVARVCRMVGEATLKAHKNSKTPCSDQAALNYLYRHDLYNIDQPLLVGPLDAFLHPIVAHGEAIKQDVFDAYQAWKDDEYFTGLINDDTGGEYLIFHQWDRTEYHDAVMRKYGITA